MRDMIANGISVGICAKCAGVGEICDNCRLPQGYEYEVADQILKYQREEMERVKNPYPKTDYPSGVTRHCTFEGCRENFLSLFRPEEAKKENE